MFDDAARKAGSIIRRSAITSMILWGLIAFIGGIMVGKAIGMVFIGVILGAIVAAVLVIRIRNSVLYQLAIMDACKKIMESGHNGM